MRQIRRFVSLTSRERQLFLHALALLSLIRLGLWRLSFHDLRCRLARLPLNSSRQSTSPVAIKTIVWAVEAASRLQPGGVKCLAQALATQYLLALNGYVAHLRIGVAKEASGKLEAHAWVEYQGKVIIGGIQDLSTFTPLPVLNIEM
jgi:hypothetical protein